ncbi:MAG: HlyD family efflux transporter periplasmic adaptor subunit [Chryseolinea sp.]
MLPKEILNHTVDSLHAARRNHTNLIYRAVLLFIGIGVALLPLIEVDVTIQSPAVIRPSTDKTNIHSLVSGVVDKTFVKENTFVKRSDTLYVIENKLLRERERHLMRRALELSFLLDDIRAIIIHIKTHGSIPDLKTQYFQQVLSQFYQNQTDASLQYRKAKTEYDRSAILHQQQVIADAEFEDDNFELDKARQEFQLLKNTQLGQLRDHELAYLKEFNDVQFQRSETSKEKENFIIKAPCAGTVLSGNGLYKGSAVTIGMALAEISPDTSLITEVYVSPSDVGLLRPEMIVAFQIDAFNHNDWGLASGTVVDISNDVVVVGERPAFKVKCTLRSNYLQLRNGYKGFLKKGMTVSARFLVTERTVWQLLFDKVDDWINPKINHKTT